MACDNNSGLVTGMGIGKMGDPNTRFKRNFQFIFTVQTCSGKIVPPDFVRSTSRPSITIEDTEINFLNEKTWIPGKPTWEPITIIYSDVATDDNIQLWSWLASVYDFTSECRYMNSRRADYAGVGILTMVDGCANKIEQWVLNDMWPTNVKFGDLAYDNTEISTIEVTVRYSKVTYKNFCGSQPTRCGCTPCGTTSAGANTQQRTNTIISG